MPTRRKAPTRRAPSAAVTGGRPGRYVLSLYVAGLNRRSEEAIRTTVGFCDEYLSGRYTLDIVDIYQQPELARAARVIAAPTLVRKRPLPSKRLVGPLGDLVSILAGPDSGART